jgi:hypothetical protein
MGFEPAGHLKSPQLLDTQGTLSRKLKPKVHDKKPPENPKRALYRPFSKWILPRPASDSTYTRL